MSMPSFSFGKEPELSQEEFDAKTKPSSFVGPGSYVMTVTSADFHTKDGSINCSGDPSFISVKFTLATIDGRTKFLWLQVPTAKVLYGQKQTAFPFKNLCDFLGGLGIKLDLTNYKEVLPKLFVNRDAMLKLVGKTVSVDIAYTGLHLKRVDDAYVIVKRDGETTVDDKTYPDADAARAAGEAAGLRIGFPEITKYHSKDAETTEEKKEDWG